MQKESTPHRNPPPHTPSGPLVVTTAPLPPRSMTQQQLSPVSLNLLQPPPPQTEDNGTPTKLKNPGIPTELCLYSTQCLGGFLTLVRMLEKAVAIFQVLGGFQRRSKENLAKISATFPELVPKDLGHWRSKPVPKLGYCPKQCSHLFGPWECFAEDAIAAFSSSSGAAALAPCSGILPFLTARKKLLRTEGNCWKRRRPLSNYCQFPSELLS